MAASSSSSSNPTPQWKYDVFLSFRGEDTRNNFIGHLCDALSDKAIDTFMDDELERGEEISAALLKAIQESKISIIILSKNYASSSWCLDELLKILECKNTIGQLVVPVFYHVDPSHVRNQTGSFVEAFAEHELKGNVDKVHKWKDALREVANLSGHTLQDRPENILLDDIIDDIMKKVHRTSSSEFNNLVGIDSRIKKIMPLLHMELESDCIVVGIWGMGGIGKTTIVRAIFDQISGRFPDCYFLENVREVSEKHEADYLRKELLSQILKDEKIKGGTVNLRSTRISERLGRKKVLIVLDDVNDLRQLKSVIGLDQFGKGSRIIITTRNLEVLKDGVHVYKVEELNNREALRLFCLKAFKQHDPREDFTELSKKVVKYAAGIPLALEVLGSFLFGRSKEEWKSALDKLKETPNMDIQKVLRISYDGLDLEEKDIFCDIACFFRWKDKDSVINILKGCRLHPEIGISVLIEKSLITISNNKLCVHDLLQEMGWQIVREVSEEPGKRSRLWNHEDVCHVLTEETGTKAVKGIFLDLSKIRETYLSSMAFKGMCNLRLLKFYGYCNKLHFRDGLKYLSNKLSYVHWEEYPLKSLPLNFHPENLVELDLSQSKVEYLWEGTQPLFKLRKIKLNYCKALIKIPDLSKASNLECMNLEGCESLVEVHSSIQYLSKLMVLNLSSCKTLPSLPSTINLKSLRELSLQGCSNLEEFLGISENIEELNLGMCKKLTSFPSTINLKSLRELSLQGCSNLKEFLGISENIEELNLGMCKKLTSLPSPINLKSLRKLDLHHCSNLKEFPSIINLKSLKELDLHYCSNLKEFPEIPGISMQCLWNLDLDYCNLSGIPDSLGNLSSLARLSLRGNNFVSIPASIKHLSQLTYLNLDNCKRLESLPELPSCLSYIKANNCMSLQTISISSSISEIGVSGPNQKHPMTFQFGNCFKLDQNSRSKIEAHAHLKIQLQATRILKKRQATRVLEQIFVPFIDPFDVVCPGSEIPEWFTYRSRGSSVTVELPQHRGNDKFIGYALCVVAACKDPNFFRPFLVVKCWIKSYNGKSFYISYESPLKFESEHMVLWYDSRFEASSFQEVDWFHNYYEALFQFDADYFWVEKCGVHPVYAQDEDKCNPFMIQSRSSKDELNGTEEEPHRKRFFFYNSFSEGGNELKYKCLYPDKTDFFIRL